MVADNVGLQLVFVVDDRDGNKMGEFFFFESNVA